MSEREDHSYRAIQEMEQTTTNLMVIAGIAVVLFVVMMLVMAGID